MKTITLPTKTCPRPSCGYTWILRTANPVRCPGCKNPLPRPKKKSA